MLRSALARLDDVEKLLIFRDPEHFLFRPLEVTTGIGTDLRNKTCLIASRTASRIATADLQMTILIASTCGNIALCCNFAHWSLSQHHQPCLGRRNKKMITLTIIM